MIVVAGASNPDHSAAEDPVGRPVGRPGGTTGSGWLPPDRRRTFPASELRRPPRQTLQATTPTMPAAQDGADRRIGRQTTLAREDDPWSRPAGPAEMRLYSQESGVGTPTMLRISALDLLSKEFSVRSRTSVADPVPRVPTTVDPVDPVPSSAWQRGDLRPSGRENEGDEDLLVGPVHSDSFRSSIRLAVLIGQCFSLLPISTRPDIVPRFQLLSPRMVYWTIITMGLFVNGILTVIDVNEKNEANSITASSRWMFWVSATSVSVMYCRLAVQWRALCLDFLRAEHRMKDYGYPPRLRRRLQAVTVIVLSMALTEYMLAISSGISGMDFAKYEKDETLRPFWTDYFAGNYPQMLLVVPYNPVLLVIAQTLNTIGTFMWNYNDLFIMLVSIAIAQRFKLLNTKLYQRRKTEKTHEFWRDAREQYNALSVLTREADRLLCVQVLFSFMNNLYFICIQLLHTVKHEDNSTLKNIYFFYSFGFLLLRTVCVSLFAASINDESKNVRKVLYSVSSRNYNEEVDRFIIQATTDEIALTGLNFFSVTRSFLLTVAGTVATYEIVLVQFNGNAKTT